MTWCAGKSGNPCDRLTASCSWASRVISRMTDSVNWVAFLEPRGFMSGDYIGLICRVEPAIVLGRSEQPLHVLLRFRVRDAVDELILRKIGVFRHPAPHWP